MKVTIARADNTVVVDGIGFKVDCTSLPGYVSVIQWQDDAGWIEFMQDHKGSHLPNLPISDFSPYQHLTDKWKEKKAEVDAIAAADAQGQKDSVLALQKLRG